MNAPTSKYGIKGVKHMSTLNFNHISQTKTHRKSTFHMVIRGVVSTLAKIHY